MDRPSSPAPRLVAIVPVGALVDAKSRLGGTLDAEERRDLVIGLARRTIAAAASTPGIDEVLVVTPDDTVRRLAAEAGARPVRQVDQGLNSGLREARAEAVAAGATAILVLSTDLPLITPDALAPLLALLASGDRPLVAIVTDRHGRGTNALLAAPPAAVEFAFGGDSRRAHAASARESGARLVEVADGPLTLDLDTPDDLLLVEELAPDLVHAG